ncbi:MAG: D-2-hydroxyacid dehydrogenase [Betaproteobacteria bacterium]|nr:D-2-hydroxyacid dehydrogenase [Betaproteobacteria bacterium]
MAVSVAMYANSYGSIKARLDALELDLDVIPFRLDGKFEIGGTKVDPADVDLDYFWLSPELSLEGGLQTAFDVALKCRSIKVLQTFNAGLDAPAYKQISAKGVRICNSSAQALAISEYVIAQVLALFQPLAEQRELQARKKWQRTPFREISGTHWLIIGFGPIGRAIALRAKAFAAGIAVIRRSPETGPTVDRAGTMADLPRFLPSADVIVLACPLNESTRRLAGKAFFDAIKPRAVLVNIARGGLIDDPAMIKALDDGRLAAAVLDVFHTEPLPADDPLWAHPNIRLTSHTSFSGNGVRRRWEQLFLDNLPRFVKGEKLLNEVNPKDIV